ncbi:MAG: type I glyceraldehyde-3-phosphate dehydrogenase, partial [bacterium]|nr:type I glyceraldehyde-3-phosphate dehydrogenase [bacterium]
KKETNLKEVEIVFREAEEGDYAGILATTDEPVVSSDLIGNKNSAIVDLSLTQLIDGDLVKIIAWYDNEWGYSERLVDLAEFISK